MSNCPDAFIRWSFYNDITFNPSRFTGFYQDYTHEEYYTNYSTTLRFNYLKLSTLIRYQYPFTDSFSLFFNGGISNGITVGSRLETEVFRKLYTAESTEIRPVLDKYRKYEQAVTGGVGATFGRLGVQLRIESGNGFSMTQGIKTNSLRYYGLLSYGL